jgi:serine/threonine protein kinase
MPPRFQSNKYRVLLELGQGGTAVVYLGVAQGPGGFNKLVVLKVLKAGLNADDDARTMFLNEARLSARLSHPNIVQVNEVIEQAGQPVIVMEYLEGKPLSEVRLRAKASLDLGMHVKIISEALGGLHYSHELADYDGTPLNVVHRDVSPHNVFVTFDGQVKVLDFGIAKLSRSLVETQTGVIKGKLRYMSPEQIAGSGVDRRADVYAAGVMLWEAATGTRMWAKMPETAIMNHVIGGNVPSPRDVNPEVSVELERICMKALAYQPTDRYVTALEMQGDIEALLTDLGGPATTREVGQFVAELFRDSRSRVRQVIERHLAQDSMASSEQIDVAPEPPSEAQDGLEKAVVEATGLRTRRWLLGAALLGAAVLAIGLLMRLRSQPVPDDLGQAALAAQSPGASSSAGARGPAAAPERTRIAVRITAFPVDAVHQVQVSADGYTAQSTIVRFDRDVDLVLTLNRAAVVPRQWRARSRSTTPPVASAPPERPSTHCDPPFYVDPSGIKKFKPGCL